MIALFGLLAAAPVLRDCGGAKSVLTLNSFSLTPAVPSPGDSVTLSIDYTVPEGVVLTGGVATYAFTYNFIPLNPTTEPLCSAIPCPLGPGRYTNHTVSQWPSGLSGSFTIKNTWRDDGGAQLICLSIAGSAR
jgi:hypothetical protein